jgi:hypothetical protein
MPCDGATWEIAGLSTWIPDRIVMRNHTTHIQVVIGAKLRRGESFYSTWSDDPPGGGHNAIWLNPGIPVTYKFSGTRSPSLNREWIEALMLAAHSANGLHLMPEPHQAPTTTPTPTPTPTNRAW